ncbi:hypothetical protein BP5796_13026 [Coleophoma crateriformis]|uniref:FHA domain-containing protein n=1 Tax=Coleophoma crateriformis TaxID=565419 RepID=A0A3D8Q555_9HELO|nr:hypothetical protein BP5796_13026 [Coleophoma crateriformis]
MWVLEELEGHVFCGARFIFGRTLKNGGEQFIILDKTVSRKQSIVEVSPIGNATIRSPPEVTITDVGSKYGTFLDGKQIHSKTPLLKTYHIIQLGRCKSHFRYAAWN